ncbi:uncharacterized protein LOC111048253 [Nilaparvata lugens]|uniref:uncharacterized protein LOC111048253 n=1 Tax=Nilaparvata lugens TaxID=108931 RepID=UPI00193D54AE|nr:uncharacterized protein LOC111048253 [Nilaparvata lugens]XP_039282081.1 uncharacterized protein LOC111048253 [Nilaparvata lugens]XP_039282082.1 uncharacterized protein LOC111048253 [Nilaparvata lugens]
MPSKKTTRVMRKSNIFNNLCLPSRLLKMKMFSNFTKRMLMIVIEDLSAILNIFHAEGMDWCSFQSIFDELRRTSNIKLEKMQLRKILNMASVLGIVSVNQRDRNLFKLRNDAQGFLLMVTPEFSQSL